ncbi:Uncharacterised protein (plasmid) [Mycoplasmopsis gallopavonis]|uniref:Uncharacterized protein n=1 Tax=Mycoplasmopsis gallopavonis TaxID=76629 RepID=A0A449B0J8_9BACT|nr:Uncharacterised protein [Mycoplasmopsis gallopavonis]
MNKQILSKTWFIMLFILGVLFLGIAITFLHTIKINTLTIISFSLSFILLLSFLCLIIFQISFLKNHKLLNWDTKSGQKV